MKRSGLLLALSLVLPGVALAQDYDGGIDAHGFVLTAQDGDVRDGFVLHRPGAMQSGQWFGGGVLEVASRTLVLVNETGDETQRDPALTNLVGLNLTGGVAVHDRVRLTGSLPVFVASSSFGEGQGAALGDLRLDAMFVMLEPEDELGVGLGVVPWIDLPTGASGKFLGRSGVGGGGVLAGSYGTPKLTLLANLGVQLEPSVDDLINLQGSDALVAGMGANYLLGERDSLGAELDVLSPFRSNDRRGTGAPAEATLSWRHRAESGPFLTAGFALPVSRGAGAAQYRLFIGGGFGKLGPGAPKDRDFDGLTDDVDACPDEPEVVNGYRDDDGCPDGLSTLLVTVTHKGEPVHGATLVVTGSDGTSTEAKTKADAPWSAPATPDSSWKLVARKGDCLAGEMNTMVGEGEAKAVVPLELVPGASLAIKVVDPAGNPIPNASMDWESEQPDCLPDSPPAVGRDGRAEANVGPGAHTVIVSAPSYRVVEQAVVLQAGDAEELVFELAPTKLKLEKRRIVILEKVLFETNKATILPASFALLDEVADVITRNPEAGRVEVQGHTDDRGPDAYNLELSQRRAESVRKYLMKQGVSRDRLIATGFGESKPIATNASREGRAKNRRVEFLLIDQKDQAIEEPAP